MTSETRIFIEVEVGDNGGISPADWDLPDDVTAQGVIDMLKRESHGNSPRMIIREWDLDQRPVIKVSVCRDNQWSRAEWPT